MDSGVEEEGVDAAVPRQVDKADERLLLKGTDVGEAVGKNGGKVAPRVVRPGGGEEGVELLVAQRMG